MEDVVIVTLGGIGDQIQGVQCAHYVQQKIGRQKTRVVCLARDAVFEPLNILFSPYFNVIQHPEKEKPGENYGLITDEEILENEKNTSEMYVVCPDLLFRAGPYSFDWRKYNTHPQLITKTRLLTHKWTLENYIFCSINSNTKGYNYTDPRGLVLELAKSLPDYKIVVPVLDSWNLEQINNPDFSNLPDNVILLENPDWQTSLDYLSRSCYCVTTDSGIMHLAYQFGIPRLILDPRFGFNHPNQLWLSRWRNDGLNESVDINTPPYKIANLISLNLIIPQTTLLPRWYVLRNFNQFWSGFLGFKF